MKKAIWIEIVFGLSVIVFLAALTFGVAERSELKNDDQAKNNLAEQYVIALRLFAADHDGEYPYPGFTGTPICLGAGNPGGSSTGASYSGGTCQNGALENSQVEVALATYLVGGTPSDANPLYIQGKNYGGIGYVCSAADLSDPANPLCTTYTIFWDTNYPSTCISNALSGPSNLCSYSQSSL